MKNIKSIKNKCWKLFSILVRLEETDKYGYGNCITCGRNLHYKDMQSGHFIDGRGNSILFERRGVHIQCYACNVCKSGNKVEYYQWMQKNYGEGVINELRALARTTRKFTVEELEKMAIDLTVKTSELLDSKINT